MDCLLSCMLKVLCSLPLALGRNADCLPQLTRSCVVWVPRTPLPPSRLLEPSCASAAPLGLPPHPFAWCPLQGDRLGGLPPRRLQRQCVHVYVGRPCVHAPTSPVRAAVLAGVTGGLAAPLVAAGAATVIGSAGAAALGSAAGIAIMTSLFGAAGAGLTGKAPEEWRL